MAAEDLFFLVDVVDEAGDGHVYKGVEPCPLLVIETPITPSRDLNTACVMILGLTYTGAPGEGESG